MKRTFFMLLAACFALSVYGCGGVKHVKTMTDVVDGVTVSSDQYSKTNTKVIKFPEVAYANIPYNERKERIPEYSLSWLDSENLVYYVQVTVASGKAPLYQVHVSMNDKKFLYLKSVYELNGKQIPSVEVKRELKKGAYNDDTTEVVLITLSEKYFRDNAKGIAFKITGQDGNKYMHIPSYYIEGVLTYMHGFKGK